MRYFLFAPLTPILILGCGMPHMELHTTSGTTELVTFENNILPLTQHYCSKCHAPGGEMEERNWLNYESVQTHADAMLEAMTTPDSAKQMPPEGPRVPIEQTRVFSRWIDSGMPR